MGISRTLALLEELRASSQRVEKKRKKGKSEPVGLNFQHVGRHYRQKQSDLFLLKVRTKFENK